MKKILYKLVLLCGLSLVAGPAFAERLHVQAMSDFSTEKPVYTITFKALDEIKLNSEIDITAGSVVNARIYEVSNPKRLKRNSGFKIVPVSITDEKGKTHLIDEEFVGKFSPKFELDKGEVAKNAALSVGNHFVKGISLGYHAIEGAVKNEEGNRAVSSVVSVYKNSPLSYVEKGQYTEIKAGDLFSFTFKVDDDDDEDDDSNTKTDAFLPDEQG